MPIRGSLGTMVSRQLTETGQSGVNSDFPHVYTYLFIIYWQSAYAFSNQALSSANIISLVIAWLITSCQWLLLSIIFLTGHCPIFSLLRWHRIEKSSKIGGKWREWEEFADSFLTILLSVGRWMLGEEKVFNVLGRKKLELKLALPDVRMCPLSIIREHKWSKSRMVRSTFRYSEKMQEYAVASKNRSQQKMTCQSRQ